MFKKILNAILGISVEVVYALAIMLAALIIAAVLYYLYR